MGSEKRTREIFKVALREVFNRWLDGGSQVLSNVVSFDRQAPAVPVISLQHYVSLLFAPDSPVRVRASMTLDEIFHIRVETGEFVLDVRDMTEGVLCKEMMPRLNWSARFEAGEDAPPDEVREALLNSTSFQEETAQILMSDLLAKYGKKRVVEIFKEKRQKSGFYLWWRGASYGADGVRLKDATVATPTGPVTVRVLRYHEQTSDYVTAYQWDAYLGDTPESGTPSAIACGMLYKFRREFETTLADSEELLRSSDAVADSDVLQVRAFLDQHEDANELIDSGDICFVWMWERHEYGLKGSGLAVLKAALKSLARRFRYLGTVVIQVRPYQFIEVDARYQEPPDVQLLRLEAIDKLQELVARLEAEERWIEVRTIAEKKVDNTYFAALQAIRKRE